MPVRWARRQSWSAGSTASRPSPSALPRVPGSGRSAHPRRLHGLDHAFFFGDTDRQYAIDTYDLDPARTSLFRFGIDTDFWTPAPDEEDGRDGVVFAAGSDPSRDYATIAQRKSRHRCASCRTASRLHRSERSNRSGQLPRHRNHRPCAAGYLPARRRRRFPCSMSCNPRATA